MFIVFEGGEGAGKSTQQALLAQHLRHHGHTVVETREPGGTPAGEAIRAVVLDPQHADLDVRAEALLFAAARAEHARKVIRPGLAAGAIVVCDRYVDSSAAYQGVARGLGADVITEISMWATSGLRADLTVLLDVDPERGLARVSDPNRLEAEPLTFHDQVRQAFLDIASANQDRYVVIDAHQSVDEIARHIAARIDSELALRAATS